jgi:hypothetical protein
MIDDTTTTPNTQLVPLQLTHLVRQHGVLFARTEIAGTLHHVTLVPVTEVPDGDGIQQVPVDDPDDHFGSLENAAPGADGPFCTVQVPGYPGDWVLCLSPHCR